MPENISALLNDLYRVDASVNSMEKTAEDRLAAELRGEGQVSENPFGKMSDDDLVKLAHELSGEATEDQPELLEKTAAEMLGGQIMAHALVHEMGLIKTAMLNGLCRVCKTNQMDVQGSSICSACLSAAEQ